MSKPDECPFTIAVDTREQLPYDFLTIKPRPKTERKTLKTGDYSIFGMEDLVAIERKSAADLFGSFGKERVRFEKEFARLAKLDFSALIIEARWVDILKNPPSYSRMNPRAVWRSCLGWQVKYNVHIVWAEHRKLAEKITYILLENFWKYHGKKRSSFL